MSYITITPATRETLPLLEFGLKALAEHMGDAYHARSGSLTAALFGEYPVCRALIAREGDADHPLGIALYSPVFSTIAGAAGVYISDLWVAEAARGQKLGQKLLGDVARDGAEAWQAGYLRLAAYDNNRPALAAYDRMGFERVSGETALRLGGAAFDRIRGSE